MLRRCRRVVPREPGETIHACRTWFREAGRQLDCRARSRVRCRNRRAGPCRARHRTPRSVSASTSSGDRPRLRATSSACRSPWLCRSETRSRPVMSRTRFRRRPRRPWRRHLSPDEAVSRTIHRSPCPMRESAAFRGYQTTPFVPPAPRPTVVARGRTAARQVS